MTITISAEYPASTEHRPTKVEVFIDDAAIDRITAADLTAASDMICDVVLHLGATGRVSMVDSGPITLIGKGRNGLTVRVDGKDVAHTDYDAVGYSGLDDLRHAVTAIANHYGIPLHSEEG